MILRIATKKWKTVHGIWNKKRKDKLKVNKKRITGGLLALAMLLSGCAKSSDTENTENADKWWNNVSSSSNSEKTGEADAASDGTPKQEYANETGIVIPDSVLAVNSAPTVSLTDKVVIESGDYTNSFVGAPLYNCTNDTVIDFTLPADDLSVYAYIDESSTSFYFNDKIRESCNVTGKKLTIGELIENNLYNDINGFNNDEAAAGQRSRMSQNLYSYIVVLVEAQTDKYTVRGAEYVIPFTRKGSVDIPDVSFDLESGMLFFSEDTEVVEYEAPEIPESDHYNQLQRAVYELTDFDYDVFGARFNELKTEDDFERNIGSAGTGLIVSADYSGELQRLAFRAYDKATGEYSAWCTIDYSQFENVIVSDVSTPLPDASAELSAESADEWLRSIPTQTTITTVSGDWYNVPSTFLLWDDDKNADVKDHLVEPGSYSVDGKVREGWALECYVGVRNSTNKTDPFSSAQGYYILRFPESFTIDQCAECWNKLRERQDFLTEAWNEEQAKTFGSMEVSVSGAGRRSSCVSYELESLCASSDINDYSGSFDRKYSKPNKEESGETVSESEQTTKEAESAQTTTKTESKHTTTTTESVQTTTTAVPTRTTTTTEPVQTTTTAVPTRTTTTTTEPVQTTTTAAPTHTTTTESVQTTTTAAPTQTNITTEPVQTTTAPVPTETATTTAPAQTSAAEPVQTSAEDDSEEFYEDTEPEYEPEPAVSVSTKYSDLSLLQEAINNYKDGDTCLTIDVGYGTIKFNGEDLGQMIAAYYMFNHEESFSIPASTFDLDNYYCPETGSYDYMYYVTEAVMAQNPMVPYNCGAAIVQYNPISEAFEYINVQYITDRETVMEWQPAEYAKAKEIADSIKSMNLSDRDAFAEINSVLCDMAEYNYSAIEEAGKSRYEIIGKSEKTQAAWAPYGVLCYNTGVCYSYAQAYRLICDIMDMPCISVTGTIGGGGHIWNKVKIGGEWYIVDATNNDGDPDYYLFDSFDLIPDYVGNSGELCPYNRGSWYLKPNADLQYTSTDGSKDAWEKGDIISIASTDELLDHVRDNWKLTDGKYGDYSIEYYAVRVDFDFGGMSYEDINNEWNDVLVTLYNEGTIPNGEIYLGFERNVFFIFYLQ